MKHQRVVFATLLGNVLEYYDFMLFSFFVSILSPLYFPSSEPITALLYGFAVFALGFLARPIGGLVFGTMGDKWGRKKTLSFSIILMAVPTVMIGLLPTYEQIGLLAPIILTFCRVLQGFAAGGEVNGAAIYTLEHTPEGTHGFWGSMLTSSAGLGGLLAAGVGSIFTSALFPEWGWRIPFLLGGVLGFIGYYIRRRLTETPEFESITPLPHLPFLEVIRSARLPFLRCVAVGALINVPFYAIVGYMLPLHHTHELITKSEMLLISSFILAIAIFVIPAMGALGDRMGHNRLMSFTCKALIPVSFITFWIFDSGTFWVVLPAQLLFLATAEGFVGPANGYLHTLFPTQYRFSGVAFGCCLGTALFAGTTPLICTTLAHHLHPVMGPAIYVSGLSLLAYLALQYKQAPRTEELEEAEIVAAG